MVRAWQITGVGEPRDVMRLAEVELPAPGPGEMHVRVLAAGLGLPDYFMCTGVYPANPPHPFTPGGEVVGIVIAVGPGVTTPVGARVMGMTDFWRGYGSCAEVCIVREDEVNPAPDFIDDAAAGAFRIAYHTGWCGVVHNGKAQAGETMLVLGAAGGTGAAAIQLGKAVGTTVIAVAGGDEKIRYCRELGADHVIDRRTEKVPETVMRLTGGKGADLIYDPVGAEPGEEAFRQAIAMQGRFLLVGWAAGRWPRIEAWETLMRNCSLVGVYAGRSFGGDVHALGHRQMMDWYRQGKISSPTRRTVRFEDIPAAVQEIPTADFVGRTTWVA